MVLESSSDRSSTKNIIIIGGGIIGCTSAYYLSTHPAIAKDDDVRIILLEANHPASGASGKAGGLIARWAYPKELVDVSFEEHKRLAERWNGTQRWGWREIECGSWEGRGVRRNRGSGQVDTSYLKPLPKIVNELNEAPIQQRKGKKKTSKKKTGHPDDLFWINDDLTDSYEPFSDPGSGDTAQVHPYLFTDAMLQLALDNTHTKGKVEYIQGRVTNIDHTADGGHVKGVRYVHTQPGGGGGWRSAPIIPILEDGGAEKYFKHQAEPFQPTENEDGNSSQATEIEDDEVFLPADKVLLSAGPWSGELLKGLPITGIRAHSITVQPPLKPGGDSESKSIREEREEISAYALFTRIQMPSPTESPFRRSQDAIRIKSPEIYARPNEEVYICGGTDEEPLPDIKFGTKGVKVMTETCEGLFEQIASISPTLARGKVTAHQACYLPTPTSGPDGYPILGQVDGIKGLYVATGHTCWGICNAPGTAKVIAELMLEGKVTCCRIDTMEPVRFMA